MDSQSLRESLTDAIRYWEVRRLIYKAVLACIVIVYFCVDLPDSRRNLNADLVLGIFLLAVLANVAYCAAYIADIFAQCSDFRGMWRKVRWVLFAVGTLFAAILTRFISMAIFLKA